ncbi:MAG: hypothetical protein FJX22_00420 [Alphaproteobacteria bacterium]|nr:hypothetical protein [Alphaproteobacteria bacterium]
MTLHIPLTPYCQKFGDFTIRHARGQEDLIANIDLQIPEYNDDTWPIDPLMQVWARYPYAMYLLWEGERVVGDFHLWPADDDWADAFLAGQAGFEDFAPKSLAEVLVDGCQRWRVGSLIIHPDYRKPTKMNPIGFLLAAALNDWAETSALKYPVQVFTTAYTPQSAALLRRFGFERIREPEQMANQKPLFALTANSKADLTNTLFRRGLPKFLTSDAG